MLVQRPILCQAYNTVVLFTSKRSYNCGQYRSGSSPQPCQTEHPEGTEGGNGHDDGMAGVLEH